MRHLKKGDIIVIAKPFAPSRLFVYVLLQDVDNAMEYSGFIKALFLPSEYTCRYGVGFKEDWDMIDLKFSPQKDKRYFTRIPFSLVCRDLYVIDLKILSSLQRKIYRYYEKKLK